MKRDHKKIIELVKKDVKNKCYSSSNPFGINLYHNHIHNVVKLHC